MSSIVNAFAKSSKTVLQVNFKTTCTSYPSFPDKVFPKLGPEKGKSRENNKDLMTEKDNKLMTTNKLVKIEMLTIFNFKLN